MTLKTNKYEHNKTIIFLSSEFNCALKALFPPNSLPYAMYHSKTIDRIKQQVQTEFSKLDSKIRVVVGTSAIGMGIDIKNIREIIFYAPPTDLESYVQGIGRAGRDNKDANSVLFIRPTDMSLVRGDNLLLEYV